MRVLVIVALFVFASLPLFAFHLAPERWLEKGLNQVQAEMGREVQLTVNKLERALPARILIESIHVGYKSKELFNLYDTELRLNPYLFYLKSLGFTMNTELGGGRIEAEGMVSSDNVKGCIKVEPIKVQDLSISRYIGAVKEGILSLNLCGNGDMAIGEIYLYNLKMEDLSYRGIVFPAGKIRSMALAFRVKDDGVLIDALKIKADDYEAVFYGKIKGRKIDGKALIYAGQGFRDQELGRLKDYRVSQGLYIVPVNSLNVVNLLKKKRG